MKRFWRSTAMTVLLFVVAIGLLSVGTVGGTRAALQVFSDNYYSAINLDHIGVTLLENSTPIAWRNYGTTVDAGFTEGGEKKIVLNDLGSDSEIMIGKKYPCAIAAQNTGTIDEYLRVTVRKYWVNNVTESEKKGWFSYNEKTHNKITDDVFNPDYIQLTYSGSEYNNANWVKETYSKECAVYYYRGIVNPGDVTAPLFTDLAISNQISQYKLANVIQDGKTTVWTYAFDGYGFVIEAEVDAVQTHHARAAITSAWGTSSATMDKMGVPTTA